YPNMDFVVSGAGGRHSKPVSRSNPKEPRNKLLNVCTPGPTSPTCTPERIALEEGEAQQHGFAYFKISGTKMELEFLTPNGVRPPAKFRQTYEGLVRDKARPPGNVSMSVEPLKNLCPHHLVKGDREFSGNGPAVRGNVTLGLTPDGGHITATVTLNARET